MPDFYKFATWALIILVGAVGLIMYQHALHTNAIMGALGNMPVGPAGGQNTPADPNAITPAVANAYGYGSRASGSWTPLGPQGQSIFSRYPQPLQ